MKAISATAAVLLVCVATSASGQHHESADQARRDTRGFESQQRLPVGQYPNTQSSIGNYRQVNCVKKGRKAIHAMEDGDFEMALNTFSADSEKLISASSLSEMWASLTKRYGKISTVGYGTAANAQMKGYALAGIPVNFARGDLIANVMCDEKGNIADLKMTEETSSMASTH